MMAVFLFLSLLYDMHWENIHILITVWVLTEAPSHAMQMKLNESDLLKKILIEHEFAAWICSDLLS